MTAKKHLNRPLTLAVLAFLPSMALANSATVDEIIERDQLNCGVSQGLPGFSSPDDRGNWSGIDVDICRAVAAAVLGDADKVSYIPLSAQNRFTVLQAGEVDLLSRNTTWTLTRDSSLGLDFTAVTYYDGQGFMVPKALDVNSATELAGAIVCTNSGTTTEQNAADYFRTLGDDTYEMVTFENADQVVAAYDAGRCDVYTTDASGLAAQRIKLENPDDHMILPEIISKEPLGPVVRQGDAAWADIVRWTVFALVNAEELAIDSNNAGQMQRTSLDPTVRRLLGEEGELGEQLGLDDQWAYNIIAQVGNYGQIYERHLGEQTPLNIPRGLNRLWSEGGIQYAPPVR